jgi:nicotinamidase-related amidase
MAPLFPSENTYGIVELHLYGKRGIELMQNQHANTALLVMDLQNGIVSRFAENEAVLLPLQKALETARQHNMLVVYVRVAFREGYPEVSPRNKTFSALSKMGSGMTITDDSTQIHHSVEPKANEPIVTKLRVSAFAGSDLEVILRGRGIDHLILTGIATSGVVLSTLREAADKDYALTVLSDACLDADPEVHRVLTEKVFPRQADVLTVDAWVDSLGV